MKSYYKEQEAKSATWYKNESTITRGVKVPNGCKPAGNNLLIEKTDVYNYGV